MLVKIVLTILTFLTVLAMLGFAILGVVTLHQPILAVVCGLLFAVFGYFFLNDVRYWMNYFHNKK